VYQLLTVVDVVVTFRSLRLAFNLHVQSFFLLCLQTTMFHFHKTIIRWLSTLTLFQI